MLYPSNAQRIVDAWISDRCTPRRNSQRKRRQPTPAAQSKHYFKTSAHEPLHLVFAIPHLFFNRFIVIRIWILQMSAEGAQLNAIFQYLANL